MIANVQVVRSSEDPDQWRVALDGLYVVGFYGPDARDQAERHRDVLSDLLTWSEEQSPNADDGIGGDVNEAPGEAHRSKAGDGSLGQHEMFRSHRLAFSFRASSVEAKPSSITCGTRADALVVAGQP